jgi:hypothetical protein
MIFGRFAARSAQRAWPDRRYAHSWPALSACLLGQNGRESSWPVKADPASRFVFSNAAARSKKDTVRAEMLEKTVHKWGLNNKQILYLPVVLRRLRAV